MRGPVDRTVDVILKLLYWLAVLAISLVLVVGLILFLESRDQSSVERSADSPVLTSVA
jgi:cytochrome b subunit of formate dehydrogenase